MLETPQDAPAAELDDAALPSAAPVDTDTTTEAQGADETPEQTNERVLAERKARSERRQNGVEQRIRELTQQRHDAERRAEQAMQLAQRAYDQRSGTSTTPQANADGAPVRGADEEYADFVERKAVWKAERAVEARLEARFAEMQKHQGNEHAQRQALEVRQSFEGAMTSFAKTVPDWDDVVANNEDVDVPRETVAILHTMGEDGARLLYAFGKNPGLADQLQGKSLVKQAEILGRLAATVRARPQVSAAPAPGQPAGTRTGSSTKDPAKMNYDEFVAFRRKQIAARR